MSQTLIILRKSLISFRRAKPALVITFLVPITLIYLFGHEFGIYRKDSGPSGIPIAVINASTEPAAQQLVQALKAERTFQVITETKNKDGTSHLLTEADVRSGLRDNSYHFALILPADLLRDDQIGVHLKFLSNPRNEIEAQTVMGLLQKTIFSNVPQLLGQSLQKRARSMLGNPRLEQFNGSIAEAISKAFGGDPAVIQKKIEEGNVFPNQNPSGAASNAKSASESADVLSRLVKIDTEQVAGKEVSNPMAARLVGGYAIMFLLFAVSGAANSFFEERSSGVFQRLLAAPVRPAHILWARFLFGVLLGIGQISTLFVAGHWFFGLDLFHHLPALFAVTLAAAAACSAFGMLIVAVAPSHSAASGLATFLVISMSAVGGAWFPVSFMPSYIQAISKLTLVYWSVEGFTDVLWAGQPLIAVLPKVGALAAITAIVMIVAIWRFSRNRMFE
jgi:ABC-2 type transport system permease protein